MSDNNLKDKTAKGLLWGGIGSGGMQLLNLAFGILLSRILSPADYGIIGALTIFSAVAGIFTESGFTLAIVNRKEVSTTDYSSVFWFNVVVGAVLYVALYFLAVPIARFYHTPEMVPLARFLFLSFFIGALGSAPAAYLLRQLKIRRRSANMLAAVAVSGVIGVACALAGWGYWGIAVQTVTYSTVITVLLWCSVDWHPRLEFSMSAIRDMLPFSMKQMAVSLFTHFNNNFFAMLLGRFYGMQQTGYYTQGNKWTTMGYSTLSGMINSVGQPVMRQTTNSRERLQRVFRKMLRFTAFLSFPAMLGLAIVAREVIVITVTDKWLDAVPVIQILCIGGAFMPVATLYGNMFNSIGRPGIYLVCTVGIGVLQMLLAIAAYRFGLYTMLAVYVAANILWLGVWQYYARRYAGIKLRQVISDILPYLGIAAAVMGVTWTVTLPVTNIVIALIVKVVLGAGLYCLIMWGARSVVFRETIDYLFRGKRP